MDIGRLLILLIFGLLLVMNLMGFYGDLRVLSPVSTIKVALMTNRLLLIFYYALLVFIYLRRSAAKSTTRSVITKVIAVIATFLPFAIPFFSRPSDIPGVIFLASLVTIFGMAVALYSLGALGGCFSIIPQARRLVRTGPYKLVRHPVYLGELIACLGVVLARPSSTAMVIYFVLVALLIYRALQEEKLLAVIFPEYEICFKGKARFIPEIF